MSISSGAETAPRPAWGERSLDFCRWMAIAAVISVPASTGAASIALALMLLAWLASGRALETLRDASAQPTAQVILLFFALLALDMLYCAAPWPARLETLWSWRKLPYAVILLGLFASDMWKRRLLVGFIAAAAVGMVFSIVITLGWLPPRHADPGVALTNHTTQAMTFVVALLCCVALAPQVGNTWRKLLYALVAMFALDVLFIGTARSAYIALACVGLLLGARRFGLRRLHWVAVGVAALMALAFAASPTLRDHVEQAVNQAREYRTAPALTSAGVRMVFLHNTLKMVAERPLIGFGTGGFASAYAERFTDPQGSWRFVGSSDPHNQYLLIWVENGLVGLLAFAAVLWIALRASRDVAPPYRLIAQGVILIWCATSLFNSHFKTFPEGHMFWLFLGVMLAAPPPASRRSSLNSMAA